MKHPLTALVCMSLCAPILASLNKPLESPKQPQKECCPTRVALRYTSPKGIGYKTGYTTLEGFFAPSEPFKGHLVPFLDLRGHVFDKGKFAANAGLGFRYLSQSWVWGINGYYDYRNTTHQHYNQVSAGIEGLGPIWDFRVNGYLPVGKKLSPFYKTQFGKFSGHYMFVRRTRDFAFKGANAEIGAQVPYFKKTPLYFAAGPYYLTGNGASTWGGEVRGSVELFCRYLRLEANVAYDHFFKWTGQGQASLNIPLGKTAGAACSERTTPFARALQRTYRSEIIPVSKENRYSLAINPTTNQPYYFVFVNNTSSSLGTYESPYATLAAAQTASSSGQIIYVFAGDGTSRGMNSGITLKASQMLLGAAASHSFATTLGNISTPNFSSSAPIITNTSAAVVSLNSNNTVSGFYIQNTTGVGISGTGITNFTATQNTVIGGGGGEGILLTNTRGQVTIDNNYFYQTDQVSANNYAVHLIQSNATCSASFSNNTFTGAVVHDQSSQTSDGIYAELSTAAGKITSLNVSNNTFINNNTAIYANLVTGSTLSQTNLSNSSFTGSITAVYFLLTNGTCDLVSLDTCSFSQNGNALTLEMAAGTLNTASITNSSFTSNSDSGINLVQFNGTISNVNISSSLFANNNYGITSDFQGGTFNALTVTGSTFSENFTGIGPRSITGATWNNFSITKSTFNDNQSGVNYPPGGGVLNNLSVTNSFFNNNGVSSQSGGLYFDMTLGNGALSAVMQGNQFSSNHNSGITIICPAQTGNAINLSDNTFTNTEGYAATVQTSGGTTCLTFLNNTATPVHTVPNIGAYVWQNGGGTLRATTNSTQARNVGIIDGYFTPTGCP